MCAVLLLLRLRLFLLVLGLFVSDLLLGLDARGILVASYRFDLLLVLILLGEGLLKLLLVDLAAVVCVFVW